jgi:hypothetical protein
MACFRLKSLYYDNIQSRCCQNITQGKNEGRQREDGEKKTAGWISISTVRKGSPSYFFFPGSSLSLPFFFP